MTIGFDKPRPHMPNDWWSPENHRSLWKMCIPQLNGKWLLVIAACVVLRWKPAWNQAACQKIVVGVHCLHGRCWLVCEHLCQVMLKLWGVWCKLRTRPVVFKIKLGSSWHLPCKLWVTVEICSQNYHIEVGIASSLWPVSTRNSHLLGNTYISFSDWRLLTPYFHKEKSATPIAFLDQFNGSLVAGKGDYIMKNGMLWNIQM